MIELPYMGHVVFFMELQHNPFNGPQNILENISECEKGVNVKGKSKYP